MKKINLLPMMATLSYVIAVVLGGILKENYSHIYNAISELSEVGTGEILIVNILFSFYNYILIIYSIVYLFLYKKEINTKRAIVYVSILLCGLSGIMMGIFPQESRVGELSIVGIMHFVFAGVAAITTMLATILSWINYKKISKGYATYSLISFIIIFIAGLGNVVLINNGIGAFFGLIERITIGSFILWLFITGLFSYKNKI